jgi:hypothetical protein
MKKKSTIYIHLYVSDVYMNERVRKRKIYKKKKKSESKSGRTKATVNFKYIDL